MASELIDVGGISLSMIRVCRDWIGVKYTK